MFRHGLSLRIRRSGNRYVQTLKRAPVHGQPFVRGEWEASIGGAAPDLALLPISEIGSPLDEIASDALDPIFETKVRRRTQRLEFLGAVVEVAYDQGTIEAGERREPLNEVELEVKGGNPRVLFDLGIELLEDCAAEDRHSERGYDLAFDMEPKATRATTPAITAERTCRRYRRRTPWHLPASSSGEPGGGRGWAGPRGRPSDAGRAAPPANRIGTPAPRVGIADNSGVGCRSKMAFDAARRTARLGCLCYRDAGRARRAPQAGYRRFRRPASRRRASPLDRLCRTAEMRLPVPATTGFNCRCAAGSSPEAGETSWQAIRLRSFWNRLRHLPPGS